MGVKWIIRPGRNVLMQDFEPKKVRIICKNHSYKIIELFHLNYFQICFPFKFLYQITFTELLKLIKTRLHFFRKIFAIILAIPACSPPLEDCFLSTGPIRTKKIDLSASPSRILVFDNLDVVWHYS